MPMQVPEGDRRKSFPNRVGDLTILTPFTMSEKKNNWTALYLENPLSSHSQPIIDANGMNSELELASVTSSDNNKSGVTVRGDGRIRFIHTLPSSINPNDYQWDVNVASDGTFAIEARRKEAWVNTPIRCDQSGAVFLKHLRRVKSKNGLLNLMIDPKTGEVVIFEE